jgi:hypothetical protein
MLTQETDAEPVSPTSLSLELWFEGMVPPVDTSRLADALAPLLGDVDAPEGGSVLGLRGQQEALGLAAPVTYLVAEPVAREGAEIISELERTQLWRVLDVADELLERCRVSISLVEMMGRPLDAWDRVFALGALATALVELTDAVAVRFPHSGDVYTAEQVRALADDSDSFGQFGFNARYFSVEGSDDEGVADTYGLYAFGLPDVQVHFRDLEVGPTVGFVGSVGLYLLDNGDVIEDGHTIGENQWGCSHELSLIQPTRTVLDLHAGENAAGDR